MGSGNARSVGARAEQAALEYLRNAGLSLVARNFRVRGGEIDLIMLHGDCLAFIEVRCRGSTRFLHPALSVDPRKQRKLVGTAAIFVARERRFACHTLRFDVMAITGDGHENIDWIQDAFRPGDSTL